MTAEEFVLEWNSDSEAIIAHTSGSTGTPKEILLPKTLVAASARRTIEFFNLTSGSHLHLCLSPDYIAGKMMIVRSLLSGCSLTSEEASNRPFSGCRDIIPEVDLLAVVPSQLDYLLSSGSSSPRIKNLIIGGSAIPPELRLKVINSGINAYETYGMTETASHVALRKISEKEEPFKALPGIHFSVTESGCLKISSPEFEIETKDCVRLISDTEFFYLGRKDNAIITGGIKVHPEEIEEVIAPVMNGARYYISGKADPLWGERVVLVIEGKREEANFGNILDKAKELLGNKKCPKEVIFLERFEFTSSGKVKRCRFS